MIARLCAVLLVFAIVASVCLAADKPVTDDAIYDNVRIKLAGDADVKGGAINVDVKQGVVTLTGSVDTPQQKGKAAKLTKKVKGVKQVVNNLEVKKQTK